jgi:hypothetical protein
MGLKKGNMVRLDEKKGDANKGTHGIVTKVEGDAVTVRTPYNGDVVMHAEDITLKK